MGWHLEQDVVIIHFDKGELPMVDNGASWCTIENLAFSISFTSVESHYYY